MINKGDGIVCKEEFGPFLQNQEYLILDKMLSSDQHFSFRLKLPEKLEGIDDWWITEDEYRTYFYSPSEIRKEKIKKINKKNQYIVVKKRKG